MFSHIWMCLLKGKPFLRGSWTNPSSLALKTPGNVFDPSQKYAAERSFQKDVVEAKILSAPYLAFAFSLNSFILTEWCSCGTAHLEGPFWRSGVIMGRHIWRDLTHQIVSWLRCYVLFFCRVTWRYWRVLLPTHTFSHLFFAALQCWLCTGTISLYSFLHWIRCFLS